MDTVLAIIDHEHIDLAVASGVALALAAGIALRVAAGITGRAVARRLLRAGERG